MLKAEKNDSVNIQVQNVVWYYSYHSVRYMSCGNKRLLTYLLTYLSNLYHYVQSVCPKTVILFTM